ncbi:MAG: hypothetical protein ACE5DO_12530, partial [Desulfobacterales bacterium]
DLMEMGVIDKIIKEPLGGAQLDYDEAAKILKEHILSELDELEQLPTDQLIEARIEKYAKMGFYSES